MCWNAYFIVFFEDQPSFAQKNGPKKTITFRILQNTGSWKQTLLLQLPFWQKIGVFQLGFFETNNLDVEQQHNLNQEKAEMRKGTWKKKQDRKPKQIKDCEKVAI